MLDPALLLGQLDSVAEKLLTRGYDLDKAAIEALVGLVASGFGEDACNV